MTDPHSNPEVDALVEDVQLLVWRLRWKPNAIRLLTAAKAQIEALLGYKDGTGRW